MNFLRITAYILTIIGALNWGLVGIAGFDLVAFIFGEMTVISRILYGIVGISAITFFVLISTRAAQASSEGYTLRQ